jgi:16S rRNA (cytidine1402-2'-O)-methyltransferase
LLAVPGTLCLYESPHRINRLVEEIAAASPERQVVVCRELTKRFEEWIRGTARAVADDLARRPRKGEFVVLVAPLNSSPADPAPTPEA